MQRSRRVIAAVAAVAAACLSLGAAQSASAAEPVGGCPAAYQLVDAAGAAALVDLRPYQTKGETDAQAIANLTQLIAESGTDENGDGWYCARHLATNKVRDAEWGFPDYVITKVGDNKAAFGRM